MREFIIGWRAISKPGAAIYCEEAILSEDGKKALDVGSARLPLLRVQEGLFHKLFGWLKNLHPFGRKGFPSK